jgi:rod shape-determining protein MreC
MREELTRLREENARLMSWQNVAQRLEAENKALRSFFAFSSGPQATFITSRVVGDAGSAFVRSMLLNAGARDGIKNGQAVMTADGLAGRITEVGETSARVLLISDINSRIPVLVERTRDRAVLAGDNSRQPRLTLMPPGMSVEAGDRVVTSGHGGTYPAGLPVGVVASVSEKSVRIEPLVDWNRLEFVRVVDFGIAGILPPQPNLAPPPRRGAQAPLP